jgi:tRNA A37 threonylcarbamoyladenosine synthetase subunit TsaC/SUA5/YrdC
METTLQKQTPPQRSPGLLPSRKPAVRLIHIAQPGAIALAAAAIHHHPILVQLPTVFALLAAPTARGAQQLDDCKMRLKDKHYGTAIGSLHKFLAQAQPGSLPEKFNTAAHFRCMEGAFIRLRFRDEGFSSAVIRNGTHQGLLLSGPSRKLFMEIESSFEHYPPDDIWNGHNYRAPLCTSCNLSGHPEGSIVSQDKALAFARQRNIPFIITQTAAEEKGSYPIFGFSCEGVNLHRQGPGIERFMEKIPAHLRRW